jgi:hypothetical protein
MLVQARRLDLEILQRVIGRLSEAESDARWRGNVRFMLESLLVELMIGLQTRTQARTGAVQPDPTAQPGSAPGFAAQPGTATQPSSAANPRTVTNLGSAAQPESVTNPAPGVSSGSSRNPNGDVTQEEVPKEEVPKEEVPKRDVPKGNVPMEASSGKEDATGKTPKWESGAETVFPQQEWAAVLESVRERKKTLHAFMTAITASREKDGTFWLIFKSGYHFHKEQTELPENRKLLEEILTRQLDRPVQVQCQMEEEREEQASDPVQKAIDLLGSDMVTIKRSE